MNYVVLFGIRAMYILLRLLTVYSAEYQSTAKVQVQVLVQGLCVD